MTLTDQRTDQKQCRTCGYWKHYTRFRSRIDKRRAHTDACVFNPDCRDCELQQRNDTKNQDRAKAIITARASAQATKCGTSKAFILNDMNWSSLIAPFRALMTDEGRCVRCAHPFNGERDIQLDHIEAPRHKQDWERQHASNIRMLCATCNQRKGKKSFAEWLHDEESARLTFADTKEDEVGQLMLL